MQTVRAMLEETQSMALIHRFRFDNRLMVEVVDEAYLDVEIADNIAIEVAAVDFKFFLINRIHKSNN